MVWLKYYQQEGKQFEKEFKIHLTNSEAHYIYDRLKAHYRIPHDLELWGRTRGSCRSSNTIKLPHSPDIARMAHEVAHAIQMKKLDAWSKNRRWHTKKHNRIMRRVCDYILSHLEEWRTSLQQLNQRRQEIFQAKLGRQQQQEAYKKSIDGKLEHLRKLEKRATTRWKLSTTRLKKIQRRIKLLQARKLKNVK